MLNPNSEDGFIPAENILPTPNAALFKYIEQKDYNNSVYTNRIGKLVEINGTKSIFCGEYQGQEVYCTTTNLMNKTRSSLKLLAASPGGNKSTTKDPAKIQQNTWSQISRFFCNWISRQFLQYSDGYTRAVKNGLAVKELLWTAEHRISKDNELLQYVASIDPNVNEGINSNKVIDEETQKTRLYYTAYLYFKNKDVDFTGQCEIGYRINYMNQPCSYLGRYIGSDSNCFMKHIVGYMPELPSTRDGVSGFYYDELPKPSKGFFLPYRDLHQSINSSIGVFQYTNETFLNCAINGFWNGGNRIFWTGEPTGAEDTVYCYDHLTGTTRQEMKYFDGSPELEYLENSGSPGIRIGKEFNVIYFAILSNETLLRVLSEEE